MRLASFDGAFVRITTADGEAFEGECVYNGAEYCEIEFGRAEESLEIDRWLFYRSEIRRVERLPEGTAGLWQNRRMFCMTLQPEPFAMMESGRKRWELRLNDEKRRLIQPGDVIRFAESTDETEVLHALVTERRDFPDFAALYAALPLTECGYTPRTVAAASPKDMERYYTPEEEKRYGVAAFRVEIL